MKMAILPGYVCGVLILDAMTYVYGNVTAYKF